MNKTVIIGRLVQNPKRVSDDNVVSFQLSNTTIKDGKELLDFHHILTFEKQAELTMQYLHKGDLCCVEGDLIKTESRKVAIRASKITFLSPSK